MTDNLTQENTDLRAQLIAALESCPCPRPANQAWDGITIGECIKRCECGCDHGPLIKISRGIKS